VSFDNAVVIDNTVKLPPAPVEEVPGESPEAAAERELLRFEREKRDAIEAGIKEGLDRLEETLREKILRERDELLETAKKTADGIREDARQTAETAMEAAQHDAEQIRIQANDDGYREGYAAAKTDALDKYTAAIDNVSLLLEEIKARKDGYFRENEFELVSLIYTICEKVLHSELAQNPAAVRSIVADAAKAYRHSVSVKISLHDNEEARLIAADGAFLQQILPYVKDIDIEILDDAAPGTVIIDDGNDVTDASVPTQLEFLREILDNSRKAMSEDADDFTGNANYADDTADDSTL
jgi:flagellar assembly protein FliH